MPDPMYTMSVLHHDRGQDPQPMHLRDYEIPQMEGEMLGLEPEEGTDPST
jgi:hypothetical protein